LGSPRCQTGVGPPQPRWYSETKVPAIPLPKADVSVAKIRAVLDERLAAEHPLPSFRHVPRQTRDAARRFWSQRAWSEYCALPVVSQIALKLAAEGAPLDELASVAGILQDESLHTALSANVAEAFGGYVEDIPDYLGLDATALAAPSATPLVMWLAMGCCVGETVSRALIVARLERTTDPAIKALTARTLKDENVHVAFGWAALKRAVKGLSPRDKRTLIPWIESALEGAWLGPSTRLLKARGQAIERRQRQRVADAGLGSCTPEEEDAAVARCIDGFILPNFAKLGLTPKRAR